MRAALAAIATVAAGAHAGGAHAQIRPAGAPVDTVTTRARPEYDAVGIAVGGFTLYPALSLRLAYDDNIYRTSSPRLDDGYAVIRPALRLESGSPRYPLTVAASATVARYATIRTENSEQYAVTARGGAEILAGTRIGLTGGYSRLLEPRGQAGDTFIGGKPISYDLLQGGITASRDVGAFAIDAGAAVDRYRYAKAILAGGVAIDQDFRDYRTTVATARVAYSLSPAIAAFVRGGIDRSHYPVRGPIDRDSRGYSVLAGVQLGLSNLISGSAAIGYLHENFADPVYRDISGVDFDLALTWNPTPLDSLSLRGGRNLQRSPFIGSAGGIQTTIALKATHELLRQLILSADVSYNRVSFRGLARRDRYADGRVGARYLVSRSAEVTADLTYTRQSSSGVGARNFDGFGAMIGVTLHR